MMWRFFTRLFERRNDTFLLFNRLLQVRFLVQKWIKFFIIKGSFKMHGAKAG